MDTDGADVALDEGVVLSVVRHRRQTVPNLPHRLPHIVSKLRHPVYVATAQVGEGPLQLLSLSFGVRKLPADRTLRQGFDVLVEQHISQLGQLPFQVTKLLPHLSGLPLVVRHPLLGNGDGFLHDCVGVAKEASQSILHV